ncbi:sensor histidine kinase, partial [Methylophaga sp. UBA4204]|uniref:sensor histidine kinase n=1 Tax=Methylophaga sp. UBA4204 TaxID=1946892 RepID=UPI0025F9896F
DARSPGLQFETVSIGELLREVLTLYQSHSNHQFILLNSPTDIRIKLDKNRMRQVFHNLLKNAIEASEEAGKPVDIAISYHIIVQQHMPWLEITFNDQGPGLPQNMVDKLFEPYATTKTKGTGLGLAIVKKIIEEHGGDVWAENLNPEGAGIIIRLPLEED